MFAYEKSNREVNILAKHPIRQSQEGLSPSLHRKLIRKLR